MLSTNEKYVLAAALLGVGAILGYRYYNSHKQPLALPPPGGGGGALPPSGGGGTPAVTPASYQPTAFKAGTYKVSTESGGGLALRSNPDPNASFVDLASLPGGLPVGTTVVADGHVQVSPAPASILYAHIQTADGAHVGWSAADYLIPA